MSTPHVARRPLRFTVRGALLATMVLALLLAWRASSKRAEQRIAELQRQIAYDKQEGHWAETRAKLAAPLTTRTYKGVLSSANLQGANLRAAKIVGQDSAFQRANFKQADLRDATLHGNVAAFQGAQFDASRLADARLTGGGAAFQAASFAGADLSGAVLTGGGGSFQGATLQGANLFGARVVCSGATSFQAVNIDGADFRAADLRSVAAEALESCHFLRPPKYDARTQLPAGFDPAAAGWETAP